MLEMDHVTTDPLSVPPLVAETKLAPTGRVSVMTEFAAAPAPRFRYASVYDSVRPETALAAEAVFEIERSAVAEIGTIVSASESRTPPANGMAGPKVPVVNALR